jgi:hypothetical protein
MEDDETKNEEVKDDTGATSGELGDAGKRALDAERKARRIAEKRAQDAEAKVKEAEDADKTEVERLTGQVATLTKQAEAAQAKADRFEIAAAKGLSLAQARRLVGSTKEELEQDADEMRAELGLDKSDDEKSDDEKKDEDKGGRPSEKLKPGASNEADEEPDPGKLADSILGSSF